MSFVGVSWDIFLGGEGLGIVCVCLCVCKVSGFHSQVSHNAYAATSGKTFQN